jgi:hypothetical protein
MAHNGRQTRRREAAALHLAAGRTVRTAARLAHVGERTVHRWLTEPEFTRRVDALRSEMTVRASGRLTAGMTRAAAVLMRLLTSGSEPIRLAAARALLAVGPAVGEHADLMRRLTVLEAKAVGAFHRNGIAGRA